MDWHQDDRVNPLVRQYQADLDSVLVSDSDLSSCAVHCVHCGIRFLAHPRNACRGDLRCPFGCQRHHRRQCSNQRSAAYYRTPQGYATKKRLNSQRQLRSRSADGAAQPSALVPLANAATAQASAAQVSAAQASAAQVSAAQLPAAPLSADQLPIAGLADELPEKFELRLDGVVLEEASVLQSPLLPYVRMVVNMIENTSFRIPEIRDLLRRAMRQRSIATRCRWDYVLRFLHAHPP